MEQSSGEHAARPQRRVCKLSCQLEALAMTRLGKLRAIDSDIGGQCEACPPPYAVIEMVDTALRAFVHPTASR